MADQPNQSVANSTAWRSTLRQEKIAARLAMSATEHRQASARILAHLEAVLRSRPPGVLGFCWPVRGEVDCRPLAEQLVATGWCAAMPTVVRRAAPMEYRAWSADAPMGTDPHGIPVPATTSCVTPDVLLLPLVACDPAGYRLGYGGGYFDRTLAQNVPRPLLIGVGFELAMVPTIHPAPHDIPLDIIVTEAMRRFVACP
jgi:5-formyltetrahydrofolate cyclo-ligase